jgi:hypothetical protein
LLVAVDFNAVRGECNFQSAVVAKGRMFLDNDDGGLLLAPGVKASVELSFTATARFSSLLDVVDGEGRRMKQSSNIIDLAIDSVVVRDELSSAADYESAAKVQIRQIRVYGMRSLANAMDKCRLSSDGLQFQSTADSPVKSIKDNVDDEFVYKTIVRPGLSVTTSSTTQLYFTGKAYYEE